MKNIQSRFSNFGSRFAGPTGTRMLMDDLGEVLAGGDNYINLGGGNPATIPAMQKTFRERLIELVERGDFDSLSSKYDGPQGNHGFLKSLAELLRKTYDWPIDVEHIAVTAGSQASFFALFNLLSGDCVDGKTRHISLPLTPEYIGYADITLSPRSIVSHRPNISLLDDHLFKYTVDFDAFELHADTGAVCVSRPTNPTGNVLTRSEIDRLLDVTREAQIPLIIDNAYGVPFPGIVFNDIEPVWDEHVIYCLSLSKLGLPGLRTGIVIAHPQIIEALRSLNAIFNLATGSLGAVMATEMVKNGDILKLSSNVIQPFYRHGVERALAICHAQFHGLDYRIHRPEGAIFLWLWFPGLPVSAQTLYERLKARQVLVIPGQHFFPGLEQEWAHKHECIRVSYAQPEEAISRGISIIGEEVRRALDEA